MTDVTRDDDDVRDDEDVSPHFGGRAQPGDVLGIETGGETTSIGDTAEDENKRRLEALEEGDEAEADEDEDEEEDEAEEEEKEEE